MSVPEFPLASEYFFHRGMLCREREPCLLPATLNVTDKRRTSYPFALQSLSTYASVGHL